MNRWLLTICVLTQVLNGWSADKDIGPALERFRTAYKDIYEGNAKDLKSHQRQLGKVKDRLRKAKTGSESDRKKRRRKIESYERAIELYTQLIALNQTIDEAFNGVDEPGKFRHALKNVPLIEGKISVITKKESKREWLTPEEIKGLLKRGWTYRTRDTKIKPCHRKYWKKPKNE